MTAIPAVPSEPPLTDEAALSDAELALVSHQSAWGDNCPCGIEEVTSAAKQLLSLFDGWYGDKAYRCHEDVVGWADELTAPLVASLRSAREERDEAARDKAALDVLNEVIRQERDEAREELTAAERDLRRVRRVADERGDEITALRAREDDTDAALEAALGDRWSPDRPPADGVKQLAEERDQAKAAERQRSLDILQIAYDALPHDSHWEAAGAALYNVQRRIRAVGEGTSRG